MSNTELVFKIETVHSRTVSLVISDWDDIMCLITLEDYYPLEHGSWWRLTFDCPVIDEATEEAPARDLRRAYYALVEQAREIDPLTAEEMLIQPPAIITDEPRSLRRRTTDK